MSAITAAFLSKKNSSLQLSIPTLSLDPRPQDEEDDESEDIEERSMYDEDENRETKGTQKKLLFDNGIPSIWRFWREKEEICAVSNAKS
jgi:hypothetical protein